MGVEFRRLVWPCRAKQTDYEGIGDKLLYASLIQEAVRGGQPRGTTCNRLPNLIFTVAMPTLNPPYPLSPPSAWFPGYKVESIPWLHEPIGMPFFFPRWQKKKKSAWSADGVRNSPDSFPSCVRTNGTPIRQQQKKERKKEKKYVYRGSGNVGHGLPFFFLLLEGGLAARQCLLGLTYFLTRLRCCCRRLATTQKRGGAVVFFQGGLLTTFYLCIKTIEKTWLVENYCRMIYTSHMRRNDRAGCGRHAVENFFFPR